MLQLMDKPDLLSVVCPGHYKNTENQRCTLMTQAIEAAWEEHEEKVVFIKQSLIPWKMYLTHVRKDQRVCCKVLFNSFTDFASHF